MTIGWCAVSWTVARSMPSRVSSSTIHCAVRRTSPVRSGSALTLWIERNSSSCARCSASCSRRYSTASWAAAERSVSVWLVIRPMIGACGPMQPTRPIGVLARMLVALAIAASLALAVTAAPPATVHACSCVGPRRSDGQSRQAIAERRRRVRRHRRGHRARAADPQGSSDRWSATPSRSSARRRRSQEVDRGAGPRRWRRRLVRLHVRPRTRRWFVVAPRAWTASSRPGCAAATPSSRTLRRRRSASRWPAAERRAGAERRPAHRMARPWLPIAGIVLGAVLSARSRSSRSGASGPS